mmetsp:Transcript_14579/g.36870  ORF Transcript_14579/g.36870 Transcript_14579/m.36870 type:complete len:323 (-) Transcript_14579:162-1130(-)
MFSSRLVARFSRWRSGISLLEEADMWRLYIVCRHRKELLANSGCSRTARELMQPAIDCPPPFAEQKAFVLGELQVQALRNLRAEHDRSQPSPDAERKSATPPFTVVPALRTGAERRPQGGVRLVGSARRGDLICFFPGVAFSERDVWHLPGGMDALAEANTFSTHDGTIFSASHAHLLAPAAAAHRSALAHEINHPPPKTQPNVVPYGLRIEVATLPGELLAVLPSIAFADVKSVKVADEADMAAESKESLDDMFRSSILSIADDEEVVVSSTHPSLVMVALREIHDEELFVNFRLNPNSSQPRPGWYTPVSELEEELRWLT